jgi:hypothetical protein
VIKPIVGTSCVTLLGKVAMIYALSSMHVLHIITLILQLVDWLSPIVFAVLGVVWFRSDSVSAVTCDETINNMLHKCVFL